MGIEEIEGKAILHDPGSEVDFSDEDLREMKLAGMARPSNVEYGRWSGPQKHNHLHELLIHLAAQGVPNKQIAEELGYAQSTVCTVLSQPKTRNKIRKIQEEFYAVKAADRFDRLVPKVIQLLENTVENSQEKTNNRINAGKEILDRSLGKAPQTINVQGNLLGDLMKQLDQQKTVVGNDSNVITVEKVPDKMDTYLDNFIEVDHVVGKKGESNERQESQALTSGSDFDWTSDS